MLASLRSGERSLGQIVILVAAESVSTASLSPGMRGHHGQTKLQPAGLVTDAATHIHLGLEQNCSGLTPTVMKP
jgi:hypothetical protein